MCILKKNERQEDERHYQSIHVVRNEKTCWSVQVQRKRKTLLVCDRGKEAKATTALYMWRLNERQHWSFNWLPRFVMSMGCRIWLGRLGELAFWEKNLREGLVSECGELKSAAVVTKKLPKTSRNLECGPPFKNRAPPFTSLTNPAETQWAAQTLPEYGIWN